MGANIAIRIELRKKNLKLFFDAIF